MEAISRAAGHARKALAKLGEDPLVGIAESAEILGVPKPNVRRDYINKGRMPKPVAKIRATPLWLRADVEQLAASREWPARGRGASASRVVLDS